MYRTLEVLVINWETLNCVKMEQFLTLLVSNDSEEPKPVEERKFIWQPGRETWTRLTRKLTVPSCGISELIQVWFETKTVPNKSKLKKSGKN